MELSRSSHAIGIGALRSRALSRLYTMAAVFANAPFARLEMLTTKPYVKRHKKMHGVEDRHQDALALNTHDAATAFRIRLATYSRSSACRMS
jgi:hypothetical protein